jgi:ArsR family transcriptional regulator, arsenate/arsenite/antimonite-responsive transcriptional repressor
VKSPVPIDIEVLLRALADRTRLRLLNLMGDREVCVCFFVEILKTSQPKISRHLAYLRRAGIVSSRRDGKWMHYRITEPADATARRVFDDVRSWLQTDGAMARERERLDGICCGTRTPLKLLQAPQPAPYVRISNRS